MLAQQFGLIVPSYSTHHPRSLLDGGGAGNPDFTTFFSLPSPSPALELQSKQATIFETNYYDVSLFWNYIWAAEGGERAKGRDLILVCLAIMGAGGGGGEKLRKTQGIWL